MSLIDDTIVLHCEQIHIYSLFIAITCPFLPDLVNGSLIYSDDHDQNNSYAFNVVATYRCDTEFSLVGNSNRTCTGDGSSVIGTFNGEAPNCEGKLV